MTVARLRIEWEMCWDPYDTIHNDQLMLLMESGNVLTCLAQESLRKSPSTMISYFREQKKRQALKQD
ncbi:hypothetical protein KIN20_008919 [Parelaphostrongylus tenuis]|uniref:Uncharacterized protein n=1 Tax=Parelaphostrongylus tenuis TaxID=148309 RepID=A0AAD5QHV6_PARTN|nr:hypothetical protein KIN20_008919 [Parelaphostrongylus tenuis]